MGGSEHPNRVKEKANQNDIHLFAALLAMTMLFAPACASAAAARLVEGASVSYHNSITAAFEAISSNDGASVQAQAGTFREDLLLDAGVPVTLTGGLDSSYLQQVGSTLVEGDLIIASGSLETANIVLTAVGSGGQDGLLSNCTVSEETNMTDCPTPAGWTVVNQESFAGGQLNGAGSPSFYANNEAGVPGGISTSGAHTGSYGLACMTTGDGSFCNYNVLTGAAKEVYMSYWQYLGYNAVATLDFYLAKLNNSRMRDIRLDPNPPLGPYLTLTTKYQIYSEGDGKRSIACYSGSGCTIEGQGTVSGDLYWNISPGSWHQWEVWVKHSTCDGDTPVPDGFFRAYLNGRLVMSIADMNTTLCPSFADDPSIKAQVGGYQSVQTAYNAANQCVPYGSSEYHHAASCRPRFTDCPEFMADGVTPCWGNQQQYERNLDDIIIMKK